MATEPQDSEAIGETQESTAVSGTAAGAARGDLPSQRYKATVRLIRSRLADAERTKAKPWWKWKA